MRVRLVKSFTFEAAHWLPTFPEGHKCRRMHGHSFKVDVVVEGEVPPDKGYLIDYGGRFSNSSAAIERALHELNENGRPGAGKSIIVLAQDRIDTGLAKLKDS